MNISILSIGDELLSGRTLNTNATWLGKNLTEIGCNVMEQAVIPDDESIIIKTLNTMIDTNKESCLIITGGLGPTEDDVTRESLFKYVGTEEKFDSEYWEYLSNRFKKFGIDIPQSNRNQALIPTTGEIIDNPIGSARGFKFKMGKSILFSLPGVPKEMKEMTRASILPWLHERSDKIFYSTTIRTTGIPESVLIEEISIVLESDHGCTLGYYPSLFGVDIHVISEDKDLKDTLLNNIVSLLGDKVFTLEKENIEDVVVKNAQKKNITLSVAESCTGGLIGHRLTEVSGSSNAYKGGVVAYSNYSKLNILGINEQILEEHGAVSEETAKEMAMRSRMMFSSDIGLSITGIAGPDGGSTEKPVGLVFIALSTEKGIKVRKYKFGSNRTNNKLRTSQVALNWLRLEMQND